ncbi:MAG: hypothetical protein Q4F65_07010, partial [Propionibacteriaceae bacterium]|nr:hypothetical protein [Propionibacteriaceae bacterium]
TTTPDAPAVSCTTLAADTLASISEGSNTNGVTVTAGSSVPLPADLQKGNFTRLASTTMSGPGVDGEKATFLLGDDPVTSIMSVDGVAKEFFAWGEAAEPGSPMGDYRDQIASSDLADAVKNC